VRGITLTQNQKRFEKRLKYLHCEHCSSFLFLKCPGILKAPNDISAANPTSKSATAKFIRKKEVRLSLLRFFQNTNMVKMLPIIMIKDSSNTENKTTVTAVLYIIVPLNWPQWYLTESFSSVLSRLSSI